MSELILINPRRIKRRKARKGRMPAGLRRYWAARRAGSAAPRRRRKRRALAVIANPRRRRRHVVRASGVVRKRRRRAYAGPVRRRRANPRRRSVRRYVARHRVHHRRRHRNPRTFGGFNVKGILHSTIVPGATGAVGGLALDMIYAQVSPMLPATLQTGIPAFIAKAGAAIGLGMLAGKFVGRQRAQAATVGAVTVLFYGTLKTYLMANVPSLGLSGFQDFVTYSGRPGMGAYMQRPAAARMGAYMRSGQLGTLNPAPFVNTKVPGSNMGNYSHDQWNNDGMG